MELKVLCECGQKFKFDVEPVNGQMPFTVNCPVCNADATAAANTLIAEQLATAAPTQNSPPPPPIAPAFGGLKINRAVYAETPPPPPIVGSSVATPIGSIKPLSVDKKLKVSDGDYSLGRGILGALIGSAVGCGVLFGFWLWTHFRFPLMGTLTGLAAGYTARWLARGTDMTLGVISAVIAGASLTGIFVVMYGEFAAFNFVSIIICAVFAYRITSG